MIINNKLKIIINNYLLYRYFINSTRPISITTSQNDIILFFSHTSIIYFIFFERERRRYYAIRSRPGHEMEKLVRLIESRLLLNDSAECEPTYLRGESAIARICDFSMRSTIAQSVSPIARIAPAPLIFHSIIYCFNEEARVRPLEKARRFNRTVSSNGEIRRSASSSRVRYGIRDR